MSLDERCACCSEVMVDVCTCDQCGCDVCLTCMESVPDCSDDTGCPACEETGEYAPDIQTVNMKE